MRRLLILGLLLTGLWLIQPLGASGAGGQALLSLGFLILAAYTVGELAKAVGLPRIVGYLMAGIFFGPYGLGTISSSSADQLAPISQLAIGFIAFLAGAELRWKEVRERGVALLKMTGSELAVTFVVLFALLLGLRPYVPFLAELPVIEVVAFSMLFASIAIVHSPAVTLALLAETKAQGPVARTTLSIVLISDVVVVLFFSGALSLARSLAPPSGESAGVSLESVVWEIVGALVVGVIYGRAIALYLRHVGKELVFFAVLVAFFGLEIARFAHVELLLMLLVAGFVMENTSRPGEGLPFLHAMERSSAPVFVVFFALSGAKIAVGAVASLILLVIPIVLARMIGIWGGMQLGARWAGASEPERRFAWMGLISQAGVAIGLAAIVAESYPDRGGQLAGLLLAVIAVNETIGPILFRRALGRSGEANLEAGEAAAGGGDGGSEAALETVR